MIYSYVSAFVLIGILILLYNAVVKKFLSDSIRSVINEHKGKMILSYIVFLFLILGSPVRFESTSFTGKNSFTKQPQKIEERREGTPKANFENIDEATEKFDAEYKKRIEQINAQEGNK